MLEAKMQNPVDGCELHFAAPKKPCLKTAADFATTVGRLLWAFGWSSPISILKPQAVKENPTECQDFWDSQKHHQGFWDALAHTPPGPKIPR